jgi:hypothetical protein
MAEDQEKTRHELMGAMALALVLMACATDPDPKDDDTEDAEPAVEDPCGDGLWGHLPVDADTVFVDAQATAGGDGSETAPLRTIQEGIDSAAEQGRTLVAVAAGTYVETVEVREIHGGVELRGRCMDLVTIDGADGSLQTAAVEIGISYPSGSYGGGPETFAVADLTITNGQWYGISLRDGAVKLENLRIQDCMDVAITAVAEDARLTIDRVTIDRVLDGDPQDEYPFGHGLNVFGGAQVTVTGLTINEMQGAGIIAANPGTEVDVDDVVIRSTSPDFDLATDQGMAIYDSALLSGRRVTIDGMGSTGIYAGWGNALVNLTDVHIVDTWERPSANLQYSIAGLLVESVAVVTLTSSELECNTRYGVLAAGNSQVHLEDVTIRNTLPDATSDRGYGIRVQEQAYSTVRDSRIEYSTGSGVEVADDSAHLLLDRTEVRHTQVGEDGTNGNGVVVRDGALLDAAALVIEDVHEYGLLVTGDSEAIVAGISLSNVHGSDERRGAGMATAQGGELDITWADVASVTGPGILVADGSLRCSACTVTDAMFAGIVVHGGEFVGKWVQVDGTRSDPVLGGGVALYAHDTLEPPPDIVVTSSFLRTDELAAVYLRGGGSYRIEESFLYGAVASIADPGGTRVPAGYALIATDGVTSWTGDGGLYLDDNFIQDGHHIGILLDGSTATCPGDDEGGGNSYHDNGTDLVQQNCDGIHAVDPFSGNDDDPFHCYALTADVCTGEEVYVPLLRYCAEKAVDCTEELELE